MADFTPDFSYRTKIYEQNGIRYDSVVFGANAPITENDLNAMQSIQSEKINDLWYLFNDGIYFIDDGWRGVSYDSGREELKIKSLYFYIWRAHRFNINSPITIYGVKEDETIFLVCSGDYVINVNAEQENWGDKPRKQNFENGEKVEATCTRDERYGNKTISKRRQLIFEVAHINLDNPSNNTPSGYNIVLGKIKNGQFVMDPDVYIRPRNSRYPESWNYLYQRPREFPMLEGETFTSLITKLRSGNLHGYEIGDYIKLFIGNGPYMGKTFEFEIAYIGNIPNYRTTIGKPYAILSLRKAYFKLRYHNRVTNGVFPFNQSELYQGIQSLVNGFQSDVKQSMIEFTFGNDLYKSKFWLPTRTNIFGDDNVYTDADAPRNILIDFHYPLYRDPKRMFVEDTNGAGSRFWLGGQFGVKNGELECFSPETNYVENRGIIEANSVIFCFAVS